MSDDELVSPLVDDQESETEPQAQELQYEDNEEFNASLDEQYPVDIAGTAYLASAILWQLDQVNYEAQLQEWRDEQAAQFIDSVTERFPTPIAYNLFRLENGCRTDVERLRVLKDVWESLVFVLFAVVVGEYRSRNLPMTTTDIKMSQMLSDTLHDRLSIMAKLLDAATQQGYSVSFSSLLSEDIIESIRELNQTRNGLSHNATESDLQAGESVATIKPFLVRILKRLSGLSEVQLFIYSGETRPNPTIPGLIWFRGEVFQGHSTSRRYLWFEVEETIFASSLRLLTNDAVCAYINGTIINLKPFLHFVPHDLGNTTRLCYYKKKYTDSGTTQQFKYEMMGLSQDKDFPAATFASEVTQIQGLLPIWEISAGRHSSDAISAWLP